MRKLLLILSLLLTSVSGAWATEYTITYGTLTGTFYRSGSASSDWSSKWVSNEEGKPVVTITTSVNNMNGANARIAPQTYTITVEDGYIVKGFAMNCPTFGATVTVTPAGESAVEVAVNGTLVVNSSASSFVFAGGSNSARIQAGSNDGGTFTITVEDNEIVSTDISDEAYINVGEKVSSFTAATDAADNDHWYILTQIRDGESPMYDAGSGNQLKRTATSITPATINGTKATSSTQYLIRFFDTGDGLYNIQFADGNFITSSLTTSPARQLAGKYAFYNTNSGNGSYFGWNLNSNTGSKVDNNGATNTLAFWESGTISGTSGNNVWYMYPVELQIPSTTYVYEISDESGVVYTSDPISASSGETISTLPSSYQLDYCNYSVTSTTLESGTNTVPVTVSYNLPFTTSTTFGGATWYYATLRGKQLRADDSAKDGSGRYATNSTNERTDAYKWAFFGNPYTGIYVMNKNQGDGKYMYKESQIVFKSLANPIADNSALWAVTPNSNGGFTLRNIAGGATWYINDAGNGGNLGFWNSGSGANDGGSNWLVEAVPAEVTVTYDLYVGGVKVNTADAIAVANSAVDIPSSLVANYSTLAYEITHTGTIGDTDCTIDVTATLKSGIVLPAELSNSKKYRLICGRGGLSTYYDEANSRTVLASPVKTGLGVSAKEFAILNYDSKYYLYSVSDGKFVTYQEAQIAPLANLVSGTSDAIAFSQTTNSVFVIRFDNDANKNINSSLSYTYGIAINDWGSYTSDWDDGCQYIIEEVGDFDATAALAALDYSFAIAQLKAINWGLTASGNKGKPNYYNFIGTYSVYAGGEMGYIETLETAGYSSSNLAIAQDMLANYALNMPATGKFYRIKGKTGGNYLASGGGSGSKFTMTSATDATTIFYYDGTILTNLSTGMCNGMNQSRWEWVVGESASTVVFQDGLSNGGYGIKSATCNFYDGGTTADRGKDITLSGANIRYRDWYLTEITTLPIAIGSTTYATLCAPVALTIPSNVKAYYISALTEKEATLTEIETTIAANTPVILKATEAGTYNFATTTGGTDVSSTNKLAGSVTAFAVSDDDVTNKTYYTLQQNVAGTAVGLFPKTAAGSIAGFKAYLPGSALGTSVKGLSFIFADDNTTAIRGMKTETKKEAAIYNLAGQRVSKATKGVYIMNGKKMFVK